ncbi:hypothetical protein FA09DRAFT_327495 [Tilletiopsis washingtonensis]|jgi:hypothetical protein|uniref:CHCH domain-containing protein n=1 Tax=Tilletiopsis washingtonensis TaxID=58919 RepID=A0A316ZG82_9BASI|nr:hypothetical protein FA09DRAFT_327495 [Tilletiopsis washingtonensis]PWO00768.1 hypothetical protein FA09DRAFT_327495 [Tilletiopsis washingtonensis]
MKLHQLKVRPRKVAQAGPCAAEFAAMLACWASSSDVGNTGVCQESAARLGECMKSKVSCGLGEGGPSSRGSLWKWALSLARTTTGRQGQRSGL